MILGVVVQYVDGNQRIVHVNELFSDDEDFFTSGEDDNSLICCVYGNCSCSSLDHALANLTSNVLINITTDVTSSSLVTVSDLENASIIGHNNPTVNCRKINGLQFNLSRHLIIQGITWIGCGTDNINHTTPGLSLSYSSNVTIQNCTFQQSVGQAIVLSEMSGDVNINNCKFVNNNRYRGHGAAIHYSSSTNNTINYSQFVLTIKNCKFLYNRMKSLVYLENKHSKIILNNSTFCYNRGISVYAINHKIYLNGNILFESNTAGNGVGIYISDHSTVTFVNNSEVTFIQNSAKNKGGAVFLRNHSSIIFDQNSVVHFNNNSATKGIVYSDTGSNVTFKGNCYVTFSGNSATESGAAIHSDNSLVTFTGNSNVSFSNNHADYLGGAMYYGNFGSISFEGNSTTTFSNNIAIYGGAIYHENFGSISFKGNANTRFSNNDARFVGGAIELQNVNMIFGGNSITTFIDNNSNLGGGAIIGFLNCNISHEGNSTTVYNNNTADDGGAVNSDGDISFNGNSNTEFRDNTANGNGGAVFSDGGDVSFNGNSNTEFRDNTANDNGGAVISDGDISFNGNSNTEFRDNTAVNNGGAMFLLAKLTFNDNSVITYTENKANQHGGVFYFVMNSFISFNGNSIVSLAHNEATLNGGVMYCDSNSNITFSGFTNVSFSDNNADNGGAGYFNELCSVTFKQNANVTFENNNALYGGAICLNNNTNVMFNDNSIALFKNNMATIDGGAINIVTNSTITFSGFTNVSFNDNSANNGGVLFVNNNSKISFEETSSLTFVKNEARSNGGAGYFNGLCSVTFKQNTNVTFENNNALYGGAMCLNSNTNITFNDNSIVLFNNNMATISGGTINIVRNSSIMVNDNTTIIFTTNNAQYGGVIYSMNSFILFNGNSTVLLAHNEATLNGGVMYCDSNSNIIFSGFTNVSFNDNNADNGGVLFANNNSKISFKEASLLTFIKNKARSTGGVGYFNGLCSVTFKQQANVTFENNNALYGGAICLSNNTNIMFNDNSIALFKNNMVTNDGGAINVLRNSSIMVNDNTTITFTTNNAQYGGAMFFDATHTTLESEKNISFNQNTARIAGNHMYFDSTGSNASGSCLNSRIDKYKAKQFITTPPSKLQFFAPAICIDYDNNTAECNTYHLKHIMLGEEITIPVYVSNYCNLPSYTTQFRLQGGNNQNYSISGSNQILLSGNDTFQGISITGNISLAKSSNYTINIALHDDRNSDWKQISVNLTIHLTSCYPGFWQNSGSVKCECYSSEDIVLCSGSNSTIKRGYWFGKVIEQPTVTICPVNYCDFTCCEASNGYYHLSPVRVNQCRSHRNGTACGSCTDGYTLSFDSTECVNVDSCTAGQAILVILLTVIYWIVMVTLVFAMMYYKVPIGYLYSITYYYSIVDILLSQNLQDLRGFYLTVSIMSSFSKITPQFLGELCLTTGMSGIDQQFIHYIHPTAVILILVIISLSARSSRRISAFISRGIIHVICLLLLLSYTSIASTSLLLMRSLMFHGIDKIYTYLSPDIEYFHGRHLAYGIVALLCTITIVIGLPLLLILEPFLNHKINFAKIKPLLDQFQGCYKDKYRCFAGYYMICRLVIITIVIANSSNEFAATYLLIVACGVITLMHITAKPYNSEIINKFDGMILQLIIFITALPLLDDFDSPLVISIVFVLVLLPLLTFIAITLFLHKDDLKKIAKYFTFKDKASNGNGDNISVHNQEIPMKKFDLIVDDSKRKNVAITVCDM